MILKFLIRLWSLFEYAFKKWIDYAFKIKSPFRWPIRWFSIGLLAELGEIAKPEYLEAIFQLLVPQFGEFGVAIIEVIIYVILGNFIVGFSIISIGIKSFFLVLFCVLEWSKENKGIINFNFLSNIKMFNWITEIKNEIWEVKQNWFDDFNKTSLKSIIPQKFNSNLHIKANIEEEIEENISKYSFENQDILLETIDENLGLIDTLEFEIYNLDDIGKQDNELILDKQSNIYVRLIAIKDSLEKCKTELLAIKASLQDNNWEEFLNSKISTVKDLPIPRNKLSSFINNGQFDLFTKNQDKKYEDIPITLFRRNVFESFFTSTFHLL